MGNHYPPTQSQQTAWPDTPREPQRRRQRHAPPNTPPQENRSADFRLNCQKRAHFHNRRPVERPGPGRPRTPQDGRTGPGASRCYSRPPKATRTAPGGAGAGTRRFLPRRCRYLRTRCYAGHSKRCVAPVMHGVKTGQGRGGVCAGNRATGWKPRGGLLRARTDSAGRGGVKSPGRGFSRYRTTGRKVSLRVRGP